ncbi:MAG: UDP-glucose--hexose-1-phosphate uridylyltransferase, partial [Clostridia bacterium]|nr:UDP-glucose--hexose-1-phosphate uridylyltransferase [Clostridia bacterium]
MINKAIGELLLYAEKHELIEKSDRVWAANRLLDALGLSDWEEPAEVCERPLEEILGELLDYAVEKGIIEDGVVSRDLFDTELMGRLTPRPSCVRKEFAAKYAESPEKATDWYYRFSRDTDYIRTYRIVKDVKWVTETEYGALDITINLSKPEKDPNAIAAAKNAPQSGYPKCQLCGENEGYAGRMNHPARQNHRIIPIKIDGRDWFFQYSPYVYYNEHCIALSGEHVPMKIDRSTFRKMLDFIRIFPHYFVGSNADLPIVGGSILSHDHVQGGRYTFAMERAPIEESLSFAGFEDVEAGIVRWPMSVIRIRCADDERLVELADRILRAWRTYSDEKAFIF